MGTMIAAPTLTLQDPRSPAAPRYHPPVLPTRALLSPRGASATFKTGRRLSRTNRSRHVHPTLRVQDHLELIICMTRNTSIPRTTNRSPLELALRTHTRGTAGPAVATRVSTPSRPSAVISCVLSEYISTVSVYRAWESGPLLTSSVSIAGAPWASSGPAGAVRCARGSSSCACKSHGTTRVDRYLSSPILFLCLDPDSNFAMY